MALDRARLRKALGASIIGMGAFAHLGPRTRKRAVLIAMASYVLFGMLLGVLAGVLEVGATGIGLAIIVFVVVGFFAYDLALAYVLLERRDHAGERAAAARIQRGLFPAPLPGHPTWSCAAHHAPAREVGGDYHDVIELDGDRWLLVVADVAGKGIPAAILMAGLRTRLRTLAETLDDPADLCARLNHGMVADTRPSEFATVFLALADPATATVRWVDAGHQPGLILRADGTCARLDGDDLPVGMFEEASYRAHTASVAAGDRLILFTDGVIEAAIGRDDELLPEEVAEAVRRSADATAEGAVEAVRELVDRATGGQPSDDDLTVLVARF
jgi:serine phosphatase RsbU (regulator of sigma subunit)